MVWEKSEYSIKDSNKQLKRYNRTLLLLPFLLLIFIILGSVFVASISKENSIRLYEDDLLFTPINGPELPVIVYIDFMGIEENQNLTVNQSDELIAAILVTVQQHYDDMLGAGELFVSDVPEDKEDADRIVEVVDEIATIKSKGGKYSTPFGAWPPGSKLVRIYLGMFTEVYYQDFTVDGSDPPELSVPELANAIGRTISHELAHSFSAGHNKRPVPHQNIMTDGGEVTNADRATKTWEFDAKTKKIVEKNLHSKKPCRSAKGYRDVPFVVTNLYGNNETNTSEEAGTLDATFTFNLSIHPNETFEFGWFGEDTDNGTIDGNDEIDFIYKSSLDNISIAAELISFIHGNSEVAGFVLRGAENLTFNGQLFPVENIDYNDYVVNPFGEVLYREVTLRWDSLGVVVHLDSKVYDSQTFDGFSRPSIVSTCSETSKRNWQDIPVCL